MFTRFLFVCSYLRQCVNMLLLYMHFFCLIHKEKNLDIVKTMSSISILYATSLTFKDSMASIMHFLGYESPSTIKYLLKGSKVKILKVYMCLGSAQYFKYVRHTKQYQSVIRFKTHTPYLLKGSKVKILKVYMCLGSAYYLKYVRHIKQCYPFKTHTKTSRYFVIFHRKTN